MEIMDDEDQPSPVFMAREHKSGGVLMATYGTVLLGEAEIAELHAFLGGFLNQKKELSS